MKIAVNTRFLLKGKLEGIGIYTQEIFRRVVQLLPEHEFYFFFDRKWDDSFVFANNVTPVVVDPQARHPFLWYWWFERSIPKALKKYDIDLFISPDGYLSLQTSVPQIITVHDLAFEHYKEHTPFLVGHYYKYFTPEYCKKADMILAVSEYTKNDIVQQYQIDPNKIEVVYNGVDLPHTVKDETSREILKRFGVHEPYFIFVGAVHPRKNVLGLLKAFEHFKAMYYHPHQLVIIGRKAWMNNELEEFYQRMQFKKDVVWIEKTERTNMIELVKHAHAMVYPSLFEGFGIPIIEAMHLGVPVIVSNTSSMPEVAGNAGVLIDPNSRDDIAAAMNTMIVDENLRNDLIVKGRERAKEFSWDVSAKKVVDIIRSFLKN